MRLVALSRAQTTSNSHHKQRMSVLRSLLGCPGERLFCSWKLFQKNEAASLHPHIRNVEIQSFSWNDQWPHVFVFVPLVRRPTHIDSSERLDAASINFDWKLNVREHFNGSFVFISENVVVVAVKSFFAVRNRHEGFDWNHSSFVHRQIVAQIKCSVHYSRWSPLVSHWHSVPKKSCEQSSSSWSSKQSRITCWSSMSIWRIASNTVRAFFGVNLVFMNLNRNKF